MLTSCGVVSVTCTSYVVSSDDYAIGKSTQLINGMVQQEFHYVGRFPTQMLEHHRHGQFTLSMMSCW